MGRIRRIAATDLMPDFTGFSLDRGRYRVLEVLGCGSYGKVYLAIDNLARPSNQRVFAIKCLSKPRRGSHADVLQQREFAYHKLVSGHPNVVTFHRYFSDGLFVYVVLDFCTGGDLYIAITEKRLFHHNERLIKNAFVQLIDAVEHCHNLGVYHRDIKPENVLVSEDGTHVCLADFGLSVMGSISQEFGCGSSCYMSPECIGQPTRRHYSTRYNDIWALGVILMNIVTGRNPWRYATSDDACFAAYLNDNDFFKQVLPISEGVNDIFKGIFILNPLRRVSLPELRRKIRALDTFFNYENDLSADADGLASKMPSKSVSVNAILSDGEDRRISIGSLIESVDPEPQSAVLGPDVDRRVHSETLVHGQPDTARVSSAPGSSFLVVPSSASSGSSGPESKGPITPATHAVDVDPPVDIPDISGQVLGYPVVIPDVEAVGNLKGMINFMKPRKPVDIIRSAIQRMKILSKAGPLS